jgi:ABC-2 type transport system permease protein
MAGNDQMQLVTERGWRRGMNNLLRGELGSWFGRRRWLTNSLMWIAMIDIILLVTLIQTRSEVIDLNLVFLYTIFTGLVTGIGVTIAMQGAIVGERQNGTAAWVLSKPASREAFILAKAIGNSAGLLVTAILMPGIVAYFLYSFLYFGYALPVLDFASGMAVLGLHALFWLSLTLMLGTFFESWAPVIGIPLGLFFTQQFIMGAVPALVTVLPWIIMAPVGDGQPPIAGSLILGETPFSWVPVIFVTVGTVVCIAIAIWRFRQVEL